LEYPPPESEFGLTPGKLNHDLTFF
jgi:hypothetical protein